MKYVVLFEDNKAADPDIRKTHMAAHLDFLERHASQIDAAGPLTDPVRLGRDGLWIVEAEKPEEIDTLVLADPFWPTGLRASYAIIPWRQVFENGKKLIS
jgi:uncharacterized protein YciI